MEHPGDDSGTQTVGPPGLWVSGAAEALFESAEQSGSEKFPHEVARRFDVQVLDLRDEADGIPFVFLGVGRTTSPWLRSAPGSGRNFCPALD